MPGAAAPASGKSNGSIIPDGDTVAPSHLVRYSLYFHIPLSGFSHTSRAVLSSPLLFFPHLPFSGLVLGLLGIFLFLGGSLLMVLNTS